MAGVQGYDCVFVAAPPGEIETECPICLLVLRDPSQVECCGRVFCTSCLRRAMRQGNGCCPMCNASRPAVFVDQNLRRILAGYRVYCVYSDVGGCEEGGEGGCEWMGELGGLSRHLNATPTPSDLGSGCVFVSVECNLCGERLKRANLSDHVANFCPKRTFSCPHCQFVGQYDDITDNHLGVCPHYPCPCPHCESTFQRRDLNIHLDNECVLAPVQCPFEPVGCQETILRLELETHVKKSCTIHAQLLLDTKGVGQEALFRSCLQEVCRENSDISSENVAYEIQLELDKERNKVLQKTVEILQTVLLILILTVAVLILVLVAK